MDENEIKHVLEAALLAAGRPLTMDRLSEIFSVKGTGTGPDRSALKKALDDLAKDYEGRGIELKEVASGYRVQIKRSMSDWLMPLWEERAPRYTRALLETLALVAYRQPITRGEIEEVRGVVVSTNIMRTLMERNWVRVVGHRDVPGKPAMFGTTRDFLDYFGLKKLEELPTLAEIKDGLPELSPQTDLIDSLEDQVRLLEAGSGEEGGDAVLNASALQAPESLPEAGLEATDALEHVDSLDDADESDDIDETDDIDNIDEAGEPQDSDDADDLDTDAEHSDVTSEDVDAEDVAGNDEEGETRESEDSESTEATNDAVAAAGDSDPAADAEADADADEDESERGTVAPLRVVRSRSDAAE